MTVLYIKWAAKAATAFFTALGTWGATALLDGEITAVEYFGLTGVIVATLAVFQVSNATFKRDAKGRFVA